MVHRASSRLLLVVAGLGLAACRREGAPPAATPRPAERPSILLVTLDTTRADAIGPEAVGVATPAFDALAAGGRRYRRAYAAAPETLPAHASLLSGLYPAGHGVHENARAVPAATPLVAERLQTAGYRTAAFVSSFVLARRFGLARGFTVYDDEMAGAGNERPARATTDRALAWLEGPPAGAPVFLWVHYYDPHHPYEPPEPYRTRYAKAPYLGEVAAMDEQLGRLVAGFARHAAGPRAIVVVGDHGEGLGDHGEAQHGRLLYEATMRVPLVVVGPGVAAGVSDAPISSRRVFHTLLDLAGLDASLSLRAEQDEVVLGEAMKPFLAYGWQPQTMAVDARHKAILAGRIEAYDLAADPAERNDLGAAAPLSRPLRNALRDYPVPSLGPDRKSALGEEEQRRLASLGYVSAGAQPLVRRDAPRPVDMARIYAVMDDASTAFVRGEYPRAIPLLERILAADPWNLDAALRLATAHSSLGHDAKAAALFEKAAQMAPSSPDVPLYLGLHHARGREWPRAVPLLERALADDPDRLPAIEALATLRERQGRPADAAALLRRLHALRAPAPAELARLGGLAMAAGDTRAAIDAYEKERAATPGRFAHDLELGVLYLADRRLEDARAALDRVPPSHPGHAMALFKRAQVSVLLGEPDRAERIAAARRGADRTTRPLIESERLFRESAAR